MTIQPEPPARPVRPSMADRLPLILGGGGVEMVHEVEGLDTTNPQQTFAEIEIELDDYIRRGRAVARDEGLRQYGGLP